MDGTIKRNSGSIFIWLFVMIALFGALSYAMIQSGRQGVSSVSAEQARLAAIEIQEYLNQVKAAFDQTTIGNDCDILKFDFSTNFYKRADNTNINTPPTGATASCSLYNASGGNIRPRTFEELSSPSFVPTGGQWKSGHFGARYINPQAGTTTNDLSFHTAGMDVAVCTALVKILNPNDTLTADSFSAGGADSWTVGGVIDSISPAPKNRIFTVKDPSLNMCTIGILLRVN